MEDSGHTAERADRTILGGFRIHRNEGSQANLWRILGNQQRGRQGNQLRILGTQERAGRSIIMSLGTQH